MDEKHLSRKITTLRRKRFSHLCGNLFYLRDKIFDADLMEYFGHLHADLLLVHFLGDLYPKRSNKLFL